MSKCQTTSGPYSCDREDGHTGECRTTTREYDVKAEYNKLLRALVGKNQEIQELRHIEEAARELMRWAPGSERWDEKRSDLISALKDRK